MKCVVCDIKNLVQVNLFSEKEESEFIQKIVSREITVEKLDVIQYYKIADALKEKVILGFGGNESTFALEPKKRELLNSLIDSVYYFAAAKQYQLVREIVNLTNSNETKSVDDFYEKAKETFKKYNVTYLSTELDSAEWTARGAKDFIEFKEWDNA